MYKFFLIYFIQTGIIFPINVIQDCNLFANGSYKLEYTLLSNEKSSIIKIENDKFYQYKQNGDTLKGKIEWHYKCSFIFNYDKQHLDTSNILFKSFGRNLIDIEKKNGDTIIFRTTYTANLDVTINEGRFIKMK